MISVSSRWWARLGTMVGALVLAVFVPVAAWAAGSTGELVTEVARRRPRIGGLGLFGALCCLVVVGGVVLALVLVMRGRRSGRR